MHRQILNLDLGQAGENDTENHTGQVARAMCDDTGAESIALPEPAQNQGADEGIDRLNDIEMECGEQHGMDEVRSPKRQAAALQRRQRHAAETQLLGKRNDNGEPEQIGERDGGCCRGIDLGEQGDCTD